MAPGMRLVKTQPAILSVLAHQPGILLPLRHPFMQCHRGIISATLDGNPVILTLYIRTG